MKDTIRSGQNSIVKHVKALQSKKHRDAYAEFAIEGEKLVEEALAYEAALSFAVLDEEFASTEKGRGLLKQLDARGVSAHKAQDKCFKEISETQTPQGVIAVVKKPAFRLEEILGGEKVGLVILDEVRDPGNLGTIVRTADACGMNAVLLSKGCADIYNGKSVRSTMGSLFHIPVIPDLDMQQLLMALKHNGIAAIGADPRSGESVTDLEPMEKYAVVIGNEVRGMGEATTAQLDRRVSIPMPGKAESLNAGIAAAIMMYEISVRKRFISR